MKITKLNTDSILPLTCNKSGTCCFGKSVLLNPWELRQLSEEKKITSRKFRDLYCEFGGIQLRFDGTTDTKGQQACSQYEENIGCTVHLGRPLACRLYPLGRQIQFDTAVYIHEGNIFPCLDGCPNVVELPKLSVGKYLKGQGTAPFENAQDRYLLVMQHIADIAFALLLDSGLATSGDRKTLDMWRKLSKETPETVASRIGALWLDSLMLPELPKITKDAITFVENHEALLLLKVQQEFGSLQTFLAVHEASVLLIALALHLSRSLGADTKGISEHWIDIAKKHGAQESQ
jgi:Fe-S-cluster containining protein